MISSVMQENFRARARPIAKPSTRIRSNCRLDQVSIASIDREQKSQRCRDIGGNEGAVTNKIWLESNQCAGDQCDVDRRTDVRAKNHVATSNAIAKSEAADSRRSKHRFTVRKYKGMPSAEVDLSVTRQTARIRNRIVDVHRQQGQRRDDLRQRWMLRIPSEIVTLQVTVSRVQMVYFIGTSRKAAGCWSTSVQP